MMSPPDDRVSYFRAWTMFMLGSILLGLAAAFILGLIFALVLAPTGLDPRQIEPVFHVIGLATGLVVSFLVYRWSVRRYVLPQVEVEDRDPWAD